MSTDDQGIKRRRKIAENYNCLSRVHEHYRRQTDGWATAYSEREHELTFANKSTGVHFQTLFSQIFLFFDALFFDAPQYSNRFHYIKRQMMGNLL